MKQSLTHALDDEADGDEVEATTQRHDCRDSTSMLGESMSEDGLALSCQTGLCVFLN